MLLVANRMLYDLGMSLGVEEIETWKRCSTFQRADKISLIEYIAAIDHFSKKTTSPGLLASGSNNNNTVTTASVHTNHNIHEAQDPELANALSKRISDAYLVLSIKREETFNADYANAPIEPPMKLNWTPESKDTLVGHVRQYLSAMRNFRKAGLDGMTSSER
jgi:hypothetical protein